jgi:hypothetical protein
MKRSGMINHVNFIHVLFREKLQVTQQINDKPCIMFYTLQEVLLIANQKICKIIDNHPSDRTRNIFDSNKL